MKSQNNKLKIKYICFLGVDLNKYFFFLLKIRLQSKLQAIYFDGHRIQDVNAANLYKTSAVLINNINF